MSNSISQAFKALSLSSVRSNSDHENIYEVSYQYLSKIKSFDDLKAFKNCLVSLINLDKYYKAYEIVKKIKNDAIKSELVVDIAYILYKIGKSAELGKLYEEVEVEDPILRIGLQHVVAQNYYKEGEFEKALALYEIIAQDNKYDNAVDLSINERAIISQLNLLKNERIESKPLEYEESNYDLIFNEAMIAFSVEKYDLALKFLSNAEASCKDQNSSLPEDELNLELLPMQLTSHYIHQINGETDKSLSFVTSQNLDAINDSMFKLLIKNNYYSMNTEEENFNLIQRDLNLRENIHKLLHKLTKLQFRILLRNFMVLRYSTETLGSTFFENSLVQTFLTDFPEDLSPILYKHLLKLDINFNDLNDDVKYKSVTRKLFKSIKSSFSYSNETIVLTLMLVSLNASNNSFDQSLPLMEELVALDIEKEKVTPGLVGTLIKIYETLDANSKWNTLLVSLSDKFVSTSQNIISGDVNYYNFIKLVAFKLFTQNQTSAVQLFKILHNIKQDDVVVSSVLSKDLQSLTPIDQLTSPQSTQELLATDLGTLLPSKHKTIIIPSSKKSSRKRKPRFAPNKVLKPSADLQLDDERWLPMKLRSYYKPTKKDKKKAGSHQGAVDASESLVPTPAAANPKNKKKKKSKK